MFWGILFIVLGGGWLLQELGYIPSDLDLFWPLIVIGIGLSIIFKRRNPHAWDPFHGDGNGPCDRCKDWFENKKSSK